MHVYGYHDVKIHSDRFSTWNIKKNLTTIFLKFYLECEFLLITLTILAPRLSNNKNLFGSSYSCVVALFGSSYRCVVALFGSSYSCVVALFGSSYTLDLLFAVIIFASNHIYLW